MKRLALGRGLDALIPVVEQPAESGVDHPVVDIEISRIRPNPYQPRKTFAEDKIKELADSIKQKGLVQPLVVRRAGADFELIVGERRLRAAHYLQMEKLPAIVFDEVSKRDVMELALIENIQRENLNPLEEAEAYRTLIQECGITQNELAERIGRDRSSVSNTLRLLSLPEKIKGYLAGGRLSEGAARVILAVPGEKEKIELADKAVSGKLSVRELEQIVYGKKRAVALPPTPPDRQMQPIEDALRRLLGTKVTIRPKRRGGKIVIEYYDNEGLSRIIDMLRLFDKHEEVS